MLKGTSAFSVIIFLFVILVSFWTISSYRLSHRPSVQASLAVPAAETKRDTFRMPAAPLQIRHSSARGVETYAGSMQVPVCDDFLTRLSPVGGKAAPQLQLSFVVTRQQFECTDPHETIDTPFAVTFSSKVATVKPELSSVLINNTAAVFLIVEDSQ